MDSKVSLIIGVVVILAVLGFVYFSLKNTTPSPAPSAAATASSTATPSPTPEATKTTESTSSSAVATQLTVNLAQQNNSGETGTATLRETGGKVLVTLAMKGATSSAAQPAHIHAGKCPNVSDVVFPLTSVVNGKSTTTINTTIKALLAKLPLGINVHKSITDIKTYVACGDLKAQ